MKYRPSGYPSVQPAARGPKCNTTKWIFMPVTSTRQPVWSEGVAPGLICLIAFGPSVIKVAHQARSQGRGQLEQCPPPIPSDAPKMFRVIKGLMRKPKKYFSANQRHCLRNLLHQPLVEPDQSTMFYQLSMINQMLCTGGLENVIQAGQ